MNTINSESVRFSRKEAAKYLGVSPGTLAVWATTKMVNIPYSKLGRRVVYDQVDLDEFLSNNKVVGAA